MPSAVMNEIRTLFTSPRKTRAAKTTDDDEVDHDTTKLDQEFETLLHEQDIPHSLRDKLRGMDAFVKRSFIDVSTGQSSSTTTTAEDTATTTTSSLGHRHQRTRSRNFLSPGKKKREATAAEPGGSGHGTDLSAPVHFLRYLTAARDVSHIDPLVIRRLKLVLRTDRISWSADFLRLGGAAAIDAQLRRLVAVEWRDEEGDRILSELLGCLESLAANNTTTTTVAVTGPCLTPTTRPVTARLAVLDPDVLRLLVAFLFGPKQPSDFRTRGQIVHLLELYLAAPTTTTTAEGGRALEVLEILEGPETPVMDRPPEMLMAAHTPRPYRRWMDELARPVRDCFWIFLHNDNVVEVLDPAECDAMPRRVPLPASGYVGGVEWVAVEYAVRHLSLVNAVLAALPDATDRARVRTSLKRSHFERICGRQLRRASINFYVFHLPLPPIPQCTFTNLTQPYLHEELIVWTSRASADGWSVTAVVSGTARDDTVLSPFSSSSSSNAQQGERQGTSTAGRGGRHHARTQSHILPELTF